MAGFRAIALGAVLGQIAALPTTAQQQIDLFGVTSATLEWSPATGPVSGYYVIVARNGATPALQGVATGTRATVASAYGDNVQVQVAAFDGTGVAGPVSPASSTIVFNPPPQSDPPPADPEPVPDPDPTPEPDPVPHEPEEPPDDAPPDDGSAGGVAAMRFDYTGDGSSDLLLRDSRSGELTLWQMQATSIAARTALAHLPPPWHLEQPGDFDGDGTVDLLWRNARTGQLIVWLVRAGAVASGGGIEPGVELTREWTVAARGDLDGDGADDLVLSPPQRNTVDVLLMDGARVASKLSRSAPSDRWRVIAAPDADGDGTAELLWENLDSHALSIEWMSHPGQAVSLVSQPGRWRVLGAGDLDGDGDDDLLAMERTTRRIQPWLLDGEQVSRASWSSAVRDDVWSYRGMGDFDGDGRADPFWFHKWRRTIVLWLSRPGAFEIRVLGTQTGGDEPVGDKGD